MDVSLAVCEIFGVKERRDLENQVKSNEKWRCSTEHMWLSIGRALKM